MSIWWSNFQNFDKLKSNLHTFSEQKLPNYPYLRPSVTKAYIQWQWAKHQANHSHLTHETSQRMQHQANHRKSASPKKTDIFLPRILVQLQKLRMYGVPYDTGKVKMIMHNSHLETNSRKKIQKLNIHLSSFYLLQSTVLDMVITMHKTKNNKKLESSTW